MARQVIESELRAVTVQEGLMITHFPAWLACALLGVVGAIVARAYRETRTERALALGAAAPALILGFANGGTETTEGTASGDGGRIVGALLPKVAYAQETIALSPDTMRVEGAGAGAGAKLC
jgi:hypothetical protein